MDLDQQRPQVAHALPESGRGVSQRLRLRVARRGVRRLGQRRKPERDPRQVLHDAVVQVGRDPAPLLRWRPPPRLRADARARLWPRCSPRAIDHASGSWSNSRTSSPPSSGGAIALSSCSALALTESKRW